MDPTQIVNIIIFVILIIFSGVFSCTETAFLSVNKIRMRNLAEEGNKKAAIVEKLLSNDDRLFSSILVGNNLVNIGASSLTTSFVISLFGDSGTLVAIATGVVTLTILIFGEITPKSFATKNADAIALFLSRFTSFACFIFTPVVFFLNIITGFFIKVLGGNRDNGPTMTEEDLKTIVTVGHEEGVLEEEEKEMINNVFEFNDKFVSEIMVPRNKIFALDIDMTIAEVIEKLSVDMRYSRIPVYDENMDNIKGIIYIKDLLISNKNKNSKIKSLVKEAYFVSETKRVNELFQELRKDKKQIAIVLDEYGGTAGMVTMEDILEEIVGEIYDEYDKETDKFKKIDNNTFLFDASIALYDVEKFLDIDIDEDDVDTLGGYLIKKLDRIPKDGEKPIVETEKVTYKIEKVKDRKILKVKACKNF